MIAATIEAVALSQEADDEFLDVSPFDLAGRDPAWVERFRQWWVDRSTIMTGEPIEQDDVSEPFPPEE